MIPVEQINLFLRKRREGLLQRLFCAEDPCIYQTSKEGNRTETWKNVAVLIFLVALFL
ncbi:hypothetical protein D920_02380 [Enterococcus faecalis 13-SD-W-01]|nr:hypothetical protein D920_02380 [Enterococcus faecalis 13-SD-W-01]